MGRLGGEIGVDPNVILATSHGRRSIDTLKLYDESKANWEYVNFIEGRIPFEYGQDAVEIPGARNVLDNLEQSGVPWAIVTSGTGALAGGWIQVMKLARPKNLVVAEDVSHGKPDPECYLMGRDRLALSSTSSVLVVEDAPAGVRAGKAAGFKVLGLATTHDVQHLKDAGADWIIRDLRSFVLKGWNEDKKVAEVEIRDALTN
ncbi:putative glycerol-3-phosphate phosphatase [Phaeomoniella chlamydospora]|uniref:Putative glycerol-3-phosphate phosphatase n=1 Tax=Phaeomoniella chlamydospora TaxID=158046 RepID=A0A0G2G8J2_PHACM|nr:putative glycerol-3-phosphate phosphatase [Phaeomoniella chlamydospora]